MPDPIGTLARSQMSTSQVKAIDQLIEERGPPFSVFWTKNGEAGACYSPPNHPHYRPPADGCVVFPYNGAKEPECQTNLPLLQEMELLLQTLSLGLEQTEGH